MSYRDLREFMAQLEQGGELRRVREPVSPHLEMTAVADRVLRAGGPALLFENHRPPHARAGQPVRHAAAGGARDGRRT